MSSKLRVALGAALVGVGLPFLLPGTLAALIYGARSVRELLTFFFLILLYVGASFIAGFGLAVILEGAKGIFSEKESQ